MVSGIGLFPDVGSSAWLPHLPKGLGEYIGNALHFSESHSRLEGSRYFFGLGLTGCRLNGADAVVAGIATHFVPRDRLPELETAVCSVSACPSTARKELLEILSKFSAPVDEASSPIVANASVIKYDVDAVSVYFIQHTSDFCITYSKCFANKESVEDIVVALHSAAVGSSLDVGSPWASKTLETIQKMSPTSLKLTHEQLKRGRALDLKGCLEMVRPLFDMNDDDWHYRDDEHDNDDHGDDDSNDGEH